MALRNLSSLPSSRLAVLLTGQEDTLNWELGELGLPVRKMRGEGDCCFDALRLAMDRDRDAPKSHKLVGATIFATLKRDSSLRALLEGLGTDFCGLK